MKLSIIITAIFVLPLVIQAQHQCGTIATEASIAHLKELKALHKQHGVEKSNDPIYIPIAFLVARSNDGTGGPNESDIFDMLCRLNDGFEDAGMQFYLKDGLHYVDNDVILNYDGEESIYNGIMSYLRVPNAINVWLLNKATKVGVGGNDVVPPAGFVDTPLFFDNPKLWIVIRKEEVRYSSNALTHEVGHYFNLVHTHSGFDDFPFVPDPVPQWAINRGITESSPNPVMVDQFGREAEKQDGSNCETTGDLICDTPPDYNGTGISDCSYNRGARDPNGELIQPDPRNNMSYFISCVDAEGHFSPMQNELMKTSYKFTTWHLPLKLFNETSFPSVNGTPVLTQLANSESISSSSATLEWQPVEGASSYLVQVDVVPGFSSPFRIEEIVNTNDFEVSDLIAGRTYYWKVKAFNPYYTCGSFSKTGSFIVSDVTSTNNQPSFVKELNIYPTPLHDEAFYVNLTTQQAFSAQLSLLDLSGRKNTHWQEKLLVQ